MATIKEKLQSLIDKANVTTNKRDTDITEAVKSLVLGYGQGGGSCSGKHIVDVDRLPEKGVEGTIYRVEETRLTELGVQTESGELSPFLWYFMLLLSAEVNIYNINSLDEVKEPQFVEDTLTLYFVMPEKMLYIWVEDENGNCVWSPIPDGSVLDGEEVHYITKNEYAYYEWVSEAFHDVIVTYEGMRLSVSSICSTLGVEHSFNIIPTKTTEGIKISAGEVLNDSDATLHLYYIEDENGIYAYGDNGNGTNEWYIYDDDITFDGFVVDEVDVVTEGCYAVGGYPGWKKYLRPSGQITVRQNNIAVDVRNVSRVKIKATEYGGKVVYG